MSLLLSNERTVLGNMVRMYRQLVDDYEVKFPVNEWIAQLDKDTDYHSMYETWAHSDFDPRFEPTAIRYGVDEDSLQVDKVQAFHAFPAFEVAILKSKKDIGGKTMPQYLADVRIDKMKKLLSEGFTMSQVAMIFNVHRATVTRSAGE